MRDSSEATRARDSSILIESEIQQNIITGIGFLTHRWPCLHWLHAIPNGGLRNKREAARLKREGVTAGIADLFLPYPIFDRSGNLVYCGLYVEVKTARGKQSPQQKRFEEYCHSVRYKYVIVRTANDGISEIVSYLGGK